MYIEEYSPDLQYIKGESNIMAVALSRLDCDEEVSQQEAFITDEMCSDWYCYAKEEKTEDINHNNQSGSTYKTISTEVQGVQPATESDCSIKCGLL